MPSGREKLIVTLVNVQKDQIKYGKLLAKLAEKITCNKLCVYIIGPYIIGRKIKNEKLHLKLFTMINHVTEWFEIAKYDNKIAISIANLVETAWLYRYPRPIEITYDLGSEFVGH